tara:strand:- start:128 stop:328 length:201 start_codon:yes stop_codon:yes gene_type:complete
MPQFSITVLSRQARGAAFRKDEDMAKSSRWSQWVITESADPRLPLPWAVGGRVRKTRTRPSALSPV